MFNMKTSLSLKASVGQERQIATFNSKVFKAGNIFTRRKRDQPRFNFFSIINKTRDCIRSAFLSSGQQTCCSSTTENFNNSSFPTTCQNHRHAEACWSQTKNYLKWSEKRSQPAKAPEQHLHSITDVTSKQFSDLFKEPSGGRGQTQ